jgi:hypothetical protein
MPSYDELRAAAEPVSAAAEKPQRPLFVVSINTSSIAAGANETLSALRALGEQRGFDVGITGDTGMAWAEPVVQVRRPRRQTACPRSPTSNGTRRRCAG